MRSCSGRGARGIGVRDKDDALIVCIVVAFTLSLIEVRPVEDFR
jgi:hypothetical protein